MANDVPQMFDWDAVNNQPGDRWSRPELNHTVVDFVAGTEYMVRAPPPYTLVFLIEVTHTAVQTGAAVCAPFHSLLSHESDKVWSPPPSARSKRISTAYRTMSSAPRWRSSRTTPACTSSPCRRQVFPTGIYVQSLMSYRRKAASRPCWWSRTLTTCSSRSRLVFSSTSTPPARRSQTSSSGFLRCSLRTTPSAARSGLHCKPRRSYWYDLCLARRSAKLKAGQTVPGGRVIAVSASLPSLGAGALKNREDNKILGTSKVCLGFLDPTFTRLTFSQESSLLQPASGFYKSFAIDCSRSQVSIDLLLCGSAYQDVATLGEFCRCGSVSVADMVAQPAFRGTLPARRTTTRHSTPLGRKMRTSSRASSRIFSRCP
jgi:protein transport protein SEC24